MLLNGRIRIGLLGKKVADDGSDETPPQRIADLDPEQLQPAGDLLTKLNELEQMRASGLLTADEFDRAREVLLA